MSDPTNHKYDTKDYIVKESPDKITELRDTITALKAEIIALKKRLGDV